MADAADMDRHLMIFFALFDMMLIAVCYLIAAHVSAGRLSRTTGRNISSAIGCAARNFKVFGQLRIRGELP